MTTPQRPLPPLSDLPPAPRNPHRGTPSRQPRSVRRTGHLNMTWPEGLGGLMHIDGAARDLVTAADGQAHVAASAELHVTADQSRLLRSISSTPWREELRGLVGQSGGRGYRGRLQELVPDEIAAGSPLYFLLDDMPGVTLVGPFAWRVWPNALDGLGRVPRHRPSSAMRDICSGFRSDGLPIRRMMNLEDPQHNLVPAFELDPGDDPLAWHAIEGPPGDSAMLRRRRRIDVVVGPLLKVDAMFRDSMWDPQGVEIVVHEYGVGATVDPGTMRLTDIRADPRVLPFNTCPAAAGNVDLLLGEPMHTLRRRVLELLVGTDCCTHLNDVLRALAEVPVLVGELEAAGALA